MADAPRIRAVPWKTPTAEKVRGLLGEMPAYLRRAMRVERAIEGFFRAAEIAYDEHQRFVRIRRTARTVARFNLRWERWLENDADWDAVNAEIDAYNRYFPIERQAAVKYIPLDKLDFEPKEPLTRDALLARFPFLEP